jgi:hypothetical protein
MRIDKMTVQSTTQALSTALDTYTTDKARLLDTYSAKHQLDSKVVENLYQTTGEAIYSLVARLWGEKLTVNFSNSLSGGGECWTLLDLRERQAGDAKEAAQRDAINPLYVNHARMRAETILAGVRIEDDLIAVYEACSTDEKRAMQDYSDVLIHGDGTQRVINFKNRLAADRDARINTPAVVAAVEALNVAIQDVDIAYRVSKRAADMFPDYASYCIAGINREVKQAETFRERPVLKFSPKSWGMVEREDGTLVFGG